MNSKSKRILAAFILSLALSPLAWVAYAAVCPVLNEPVIQCEATGTGVCYYVDDIAGTCSGGDCGAITNPYRLGDLPDNLGQEECRQFNNGNLPNFRAGDVLYFRAGLYPLHTAPYRHAEVVNACNDGIDNDHDGKIDYPSDPGCTGLTDTREYDWAACSAGINWWYGATSGTEVNPIIFRSYPHESVTFGVSVGRLRSSHSGQISLLRPLGRSTTSS